MSNKAIRLREEQAEKLKEQLREAKKQLAMEKRKEASKKRGIRKKEEARIIKGLGQIVFQQVPDICEDEVNWSGFETYCNQYQNAIRSALQARKTVRVVSRTDEDDAIGFASEGEEESDE